MDHTHAIAQLLQTIDQSGLREGLKRLNQRVPHRYTVVYRLDEKMFYGMSAVDKLNEPIPELFKRVPFADCFCQYTVDKGAFKTNDSLHDHRLDGHIHQATVQSYVGLPLVNARGELYGTFCHMDQLPHVLTDDEYDFLQQAVLLLSRYLPAHSEL